MYMYIYKYEIRFPYTKQHTSTYYYLLVKEYSVASWQDARKTIAGDSVKSCRSTFLLGNILKAGYNNAINFANIAKIIFYV